MTTQGTEPKASGPTDIRKGDLVKATSKERPEEYLVLRVASVNTRWVDGIGGRSAYRQDHDFEVLERPIEEDLLAGVRKVYGEVQGLYDTHRGSYDKGFKAVIEFVRQYDKEHAQ